MNLVGRDVKVVVLFVISMACTLPSFSQIQEYEVKASFIEKFARYTEWPVEAGLNDPKKTFIIGVVGESPFEDILERVYHQQTIKNRKVEIKYFSSYMTLEYCHILFIPESEKGNLANILKFTSKKPILTIGDIEGFAVKGAIMCFSLTDETTLNFGLNQEEAVKAGLEVSVNLLRVAKLIKTRK